MSTFSRHHPGYGRGQHTIEEELPERSDSASIRLELVRVFGNSAFKPPVLPAAAHEILTLSRQSSVSFDDVQRVIEKDVSLAGKVLQVAQSPLYATRIKARTLRDAVQRLGLATIRDVVWQVALDMRVFRARGYEDPMKALQRHSVAMAHACRIVCDHIAVAADYAFLCGLLHDVGIGAVFIALSEGRAAEPPDVEQLWGAIAEVHAEASGYLMRHWGLDGDLTWIATNHHVQDEKGPLHPLVAVLCVAETLVGNAGYGMLPERPFDTRCCQRSEAERDRALANLGLSTGQLTEIDRAVNKMLERTFA